MSSGVGRLYNAYPSDSESDTDSASSDYTQSSDVTVNYLINVPGTKPPVPTGYQAPGLPPDPPPNTGTTLTFKPTDTTSLFMLNSRDRDTKAYPQPTFFTLRLPRVYKNVKSITLNQINLLNSFFNFTLAQQNTTLYVYESGRVLADGSSNIVPVRIPDGTYNADELVIALNNALNATPLFANISYADFISVFQLNGDFTVLFNTPGPVVFNVLTKSYDANLTINDIVNRYFQQSQSAGITEFTNNQSAVAYYYPIIYQMIAESNTTVPFNTLEIPIPTGFNSWYDYILFGFQGLSDPYILAFALNTGNQQMFDNYHYQNTFNTSLVNLYNCSYNTQQGRLVIASPSLNISIATDLSTQYSNILASLITSYDALYPGLNLGNVDTFYSQYSNIQNANATVIAFYNFLQFKFTSNFGINFGTYSASFFANPNNQLTIYNTQNEFGWNVVLTPNVFLTQISSNSPPSTITNYWPNLIFSKNAQIAAISTFVSTFTVPTFPLSSPNNVPQLNFSNAGETQYGYTDIVFPILPASYVRVPFNTPCRQDISLMTIPRYANNRGPGTEEVYNFSVQNSTPSLLFDVRNPPNEYILTDVSGVTIFNMYTIEQNMFQSADYMRAYNQWQNYMFVNILSGTRVQTNSINYNTKPPIGDINMTSFRPFIFFQMNAHEYAVDPSALFDVTFYLETQDGTTFPAEITISWYKDRTGFMADALQAMNTVNVNTDNPRNYFQTQTYPIGTTSATMVVPVLNLQQTYFYVHYAASGNQPSVALRAFTLLTNDYGVYAQATADDYLDMPYQNLPSVADQYTPESAVYQNNLVSIYSTSVTSIGYDISGVSNNLADYIIVAPNYNFYDPTNIGSFSNGVQSGVQYQFNLSNQGAPAPQPNLVPPWSLYFNSNSRNSILDLYNTSSLIYLDSSMTQTFPGGKNYILNNESVIATFLDPTLPTNKEIFLTPGQDQYMPIQSTTIFQPCVNYGNTLATDASTSLTFADTTGFAGISFFLPPNEVVNLSQFIVKFAYTAPTQTNNLDFITHTSSPFVYSGYNNLQNGIINNWLYNTADSQVVLSDSVFYDTGFIKIEEDGVNISSQCTQYAVSATPYFAFFNTWFNFSLMTTMLGGYGSPPNPPNTFSVLITQQGSSNTLNFPIQAGYTAPDGIVTQYAEFIAVTPVISYPYFPFNSFVRFQFYYTGGIVPSPNSQVNTNYSVRNQWDDWYLWNRINTKIGIFSTRQIQGISTNQLSISSALFTMTLNKVTQVCNHTNRLGTLHTREPDFGTFYEYTVQNTSTFVYSPTGTSISSFFSSIIVPADITPTYTAGNTSYPGYLLTAPEIYNYTYLPRSYGIASAVGTAINYPYSSISSYTADIPNSYTAVPFSYNLVTDQYELSAFHVVSFTRQPALPSTGLIGGGAPYYGPPGVFGWNVSSGIFALYNGEQPTYQPYYWLGKVSFTALPNISYNPATDLSAFGGYAGLSGEYQDTFMFLYANSTINQDYGDISTNTTKWRWGNEQNSNYIAFDDQSGYNFLSYIYQQTVRPTIPEYAVHVRGYVPTPQFTTGLRIIGNNYTNFGTLSLGEIAQEISSLSGYNPISDLSGSLYLQDTPAYNQIISTNNGIRLGNGNQFTHAYADALINFNKQFNISSITFGAKTGYQGVSFTFSGYEDTLAQYVAYFSTVQTQYVTYINILSTTTGLLNEYVVLRYGSILPPGIATRSQYTAAIPFQLLCDYNLQPPYTTQPDQWGLPWYLGFPKTTVPVIGPRTYVTSSTFIRIVQQYIYLKLNPAQNINTLAVSAKENLSETRESQGMDTQYFTKIILNDFANYCRAGVQLQKDFSPVLGKYEIIECILTDQNGNTIDNLDCEYDMVVQITETTNVPTDDSSLLGPTSDLTVYQNK